MTRSTEIWGLFREPQRTAVVLRNEPEPLILTASSGQCMPRCGGQAGRRLRKSSSRKKFRKQETNRGPTTPPPLFADWDSLYEWAKGCQRPDLWDLTDLKNAYNLIEVPSWWVLNHTPEEVD